MKNKRKIEYINNSASGITLIALVITIIILLILAGASIGLIFGETGIMSRTEIAVLKTEQSQILESLRLDVYGNTLEFSDEKVDDLTNLQQLGKVSSTDNSIFVYNINDSIKSGKGTIATGDAYYLEDGYLYYVNSKMEKENLGIVYEVTSSTDNDGEITTTTTTIDIFEYEDDEKTILIGIKEEYREVSGTQASESETENLYNVIDDNKNKITEITIPSQVVEISDAALRCYNYLEVINLHDDIQSIGYAAFDSCHSLRKINLPSEITIISSNAFSNCNSLTDLTIPGNVTDIGDYAFYKTGLTNITIPDSVTNIGYGAFMRCSSLTNITISNTITTIAGGTFAYCTNLKSIKIPSGVTSIGSYAFEDCTSLTSIEIPSGVTSIAGAAFYNCTGLTSIFIPNSVATITTYDYASYAPFCGCNSNFKIYCEATDEQSDWRNILELLRRK